MASLPRTVCATDLIIALTRGGLRHFRSGKTGELFELPDPELLLIVKTDRISIFDFVLPALIRDKGSILTAMTILWLTRILSFDHSAGHHLVAYGKAIDNHLPPTLSYWRDLQVRSIIVRRFGTPDIECVVRGYLTGSALRPYLEIGSVSGHVLPPGLHDGSQLPEPLFTPSTKAATGHDEPLDVESVREAGGYPVERLSLDLYREAAEYARARGLIIADTKFEFDPLEGVLIDEVLTPDSSRFWKCSDWETAQAMRPPRSPQGFDKQFIREWGKRVTTPFLDRNGEQLVGLDRLKPDDPEHLRFVHGLMVDPTVLWETSELYHECFAMLFGQSLEAFWDSVAI